MNLLSDLLSALFIGGLFGACGLAGWACERAFARPVEQHWQPDDEPKITVR